MPQPQHHARQNVGIGGKLSTAERIDAAVARRGSLLSGGHTDACRLFHGENDGIAGLVIEKLGELLIAQLYEGQFKLPEQSVRDACRPLLDSLGVRAVYKKFFPRDRSAARGAHLEALTDPTPWLGRPVEAEMPVVENGARYWIRPYDGFSVGLFLEHRDNRARIRRLARGGRVLNAFAYTCGFSVSAALGGAREVVSVDVSRKYLEWGRRNFAANDLPIEAHRFISSDIFDYYKRATRQGLAFDLIVLDPPSFSRAKRPKRVFVLEDDLERLAAGAVALLVPGGHLLLATNQRGIARRRLEQGVLRAAGSRPVTVVERPKLPTDFPGDSDYAKSILVRVG